MGDQNLNSPIGSRAAPILGCSLAAIDFLAATAGMRSPAGLLGVMVFSAWVAVPFLMLWKSKTFWQFPRLVLLLEAAGVIAIGLAMFDTYVNSGASTAAVAMVTIPLYLVLLYTVVWIALFLYNV